jgi:hypothetical protein
MHHLYCLAIEQATVTWCRPLCVMMAIIATLLIICLTLLLLSQYVPWQHQEAREQLHLSPGFPVLNVVGGRTGSYVWWMLQSHVMLSFALINWVKVMCRSYHHWLLPWDLMVILVLMSITSRPIWCPTKGSTSCLKEDRRVHRCKWHRVIVFAAPNEQGIRLIHCPFTFLSVCGMILYLFIYLVLASSVFTHYSRLLHYTPSIPRNRAHIFFFKISP